MTRQRILYLIIATTTVSAGVLLTRFYRPYAYANQINDFGFADTIGSLVAVISFCFFVWGFKSYTDAQKNTHIIMMTITYGVVWEFLGLVGLHGTFDWKDIVAVTISGMLTYLIKEFFAEQV